MDTKYFRANICWSHRYLVQIYRLVKCSTTFNVFCVKWYLYEHHHLPASFMLFNTAGLFRSCTN